MHIHECTRRQTFNTEWSGLGWEMNMKTNAVVTSNVVGDVITFKVKDAGEFSLELKKVSPTCATRAMIHGFIQRVSDGAAIPRNTETGLSATPQMKYERMKAIADHYMSGAEDWNLRVGAPRAPKYDVAILKALAEVFGTDEATMLKKVERQAEARGMKLGAYMAHAATTERVKGVVERIREEMAPKSEVDADELLGELGE